MDIALLVIIIIFLISLKPDVNRGQSVYLNHSVTKTINGLFILLVVFSHFMTYVPFDTQYAALTNLWMACKGELIVTTFLFFSGFGIMEQLKKRGPGYINTFPVKRILFVWIKFIVAVTIFLLLGRLLGWHHSLQRVILAYFGLATVGNSGWYVFAILLMYILTYTMFKLFKNRHVAAIGGVLVGCLVYIALASGKLPDFYYETILCYVAGLYYSEKQATIYSFINQSWQHYLGVFGAMLILFVTTYFGCYLSAGTIHYVFYQIAAVAFVVLFVLLAMKVRFQNRLLAYLGGPALFSIYMLQRIPMAVGQRTVLVNDPLTYFLVVISSTVILGWGFDLAVDHVLRKIMHKSWN
ncbi:hypothetical protein D1831_05580 [Lactiplantibacillus garii]|uniref:Acyltransferase 3 domain-containing protein n=1 Tax=Lactiplantibacillus garii TaxID=2306423 RepID=A0A426D872_9LACO|nr:acyltransferase family protein [Lactiplantibacillus garii]RRK10775.1 hypothetical protein D1831_05580 [Lactiplantibacillus garii]